LDLLAPFDEIKDLLLKCSDRQSFLQHLAEADHTSKIYPIFETILHTLYFPNLETFSNNLGQYSHVFKLQFINQIYTIHSNQELEALRRDVLWSSLKGAVEYIASYESNSKLGNAIALDDIEFLVPTALRLSIHKKGEGIGHFCIQPGPSIHRTPWHGTAALRKRTNTDQLALEIKLSLELKYQGYLPVFITTSVDNHQILEGYMTTQKITSHSFGCIQK
jgi:hypothetical protein